MEKKANLLKFILSVVFIWALAYSLYIPGLSGAFLFDDFPNLEPLGYFGGVTDIQSALRFVFGNNSGPTGRPVSMASFLLNDNSWPSNPFYFKHTNLLLHLACGLAALLVLNRLINDREGEGSLKGCYWLCLTVVGLWLLHPINLSTVLYPIQRMAILSTFFSLISMYFYLLFRSSCFVNKVFSKLVFLCLFFVFFLLGFFSKENAILLIAFIVFLEVFYFKQPVFKKAADLIRRHMFVVIVLVLAVVVISSGWWAQGYERRDFELHERIKYQFPIVGDYILKLVLPRVSDFNFFSGDYETISERKFTGIDYLRSVVAIAFLMFLIVSIRFKQGLFVLGLSWFFIFHAFESTFYPLETYFEHRNYLPGIGLILFIVSSANLFFNKIFKGSFLKSGILFAGIAYLSVSLFLLSLTWAKPDRLFLKWEMDEPQSARAKVIYASILEQRTFPENSVEHIDRAIKLRPEAIGLHLKKMRLICKFELDYSPEGAEKALMRANQFDMGVVREMEGLIAIDKNSNGLICESLGYPISLQRIFSQIEDADATVWNATRAANYYSLKSDFFAREGNLDSSVKSIDRAIEYTPTVDVYLKKSVMLASAGLEEAALSALEGARVADNARPMFYPSRMLEIDQLRQQIANNNESGPESGVPDDG